MDEKHIFDKQDADLFLVEDRDLKAQAIRCSIVPRLLELANAAIAEAAELYGVEPLGIANPQTLCRECNIGKSNKNQNRKKDNK